MQWGPDLEAAKKTESAVREAARKRKDDEAKRKDDESRKDRKKDPARIIPDVSEYPPGQRPCMHIGTSGGGSFKPKRQDGKLIPGSTVHCYYLCGETKYDEWRVGNSSDVCLQNPPTW
jgi:hypothetical protein